MNAVLISIKPRWCGKIAGGEKTVEIRKSRPNLKPPFRCYIYCSMPKTKDPRQVLEVHGVDGKIRKANGKVIGEFICDRITPLFNICTDNWKYLLGETHEWHKQLVERACLSEAELKAYANGKNCYAWHISSLYIYDKPKELSEFRNPCKEWDKDSPRCGRCEYYYYESNESVGFYDECLCDGLKHITRPPQSWCYVEED